MTLVVKIHALRIPRLANTPMHIFIPLAASGTTSTSRMPSFRQCLIVLFLILMHRRTGFCKSSKTLTVSGGVQCGIELRWSFFFDFG
jgi:ABC-type uncharacterized transport system permease subunit